jgi:nicotinate-nucleotide adenylyltransferase
MSAENALASRHVALFGGTFDPIHHTHRAIIDAVLDTGLVDLVLVIPNRDPWQKSEVIASAQDRLEMCRLALGLHADVEISDIEIRRDGPSYTIDTVRELAQLHPEWKMSLVLGADSIATFHSWHLADELSHLVEILGIARPGHEFHSDAPLPHPLRINRVEMKESTLSATEIRAELNAGRVPPGLNPAVLHYIHTHSLYVGD